MLFNQYLTESKREWRPKEFAYVSKGQLRHVLKGHPDSSIITSGSRDEEFVQVSKVLHSQEEFDTYFSDRSPNKIALNWDYFPLAVISVKGWKISMPFSSLRPVGENV